jgi:hypothetical protein
MKSALKVKILFPSVLLKLSAVLLEIIFPSFMTRATADAVSFKSVLGFIIPLTGMIEMIPSAYPVTFTGTKSAIQSP